MRSLALLLMLAGCTAAPVPVEERLGKAPLPWNCCYVDVHGLCADTRPGPCPTPRAQVRP